MSKRCHVLETCHFKSNRWQHFCLPYQCEPTLGEIPIRHIMIIRRCLYVMFLLGRKSQHGKQIRFRVDSLCKGRQIGSHNICLPFIPPKNMLGNDPILSIFQTYEIHDLFIYSFIYFGNTGL